MTRDSKRISVVLVALAFSIAPLAAWADDDDDDRRSFRFQPLAASAACTAGGNPEKPFVLPPGFEQIVFAREGDGGTIDLWDMNTQNETGRQFGRYLFRTAETRGMGQVSVTDLRSNETRVVAQRADWERFDGIAWTPWGTLIAAEEVVVAALPDAQVPQARAGLVYELFVDRNDPTRLDPARETINPNDGTLDNVRDGIRPRPALGSKSHEGLRFDEEGNLYGISESSPPSGGYIFKFVPDRPADLSTGLLYALKVTQPDGDRTGRAEWVALDRAAVRTDADSAATAKGATGYGRPEDVETDVITGRRDALGNVLYVAITSESRVLGVTLSDEDRPRVFDFVRAGVNAPADFESPDNLALDDSGNLYIAEDAGGPPGDDIWVAVPSRGGDDDDDRGAFGLAGKTVRFASLTDCVAEPTGIYFDIRGGKTVLYVNVQHRGGDGRDLAVAISQTRRDDDEDDD